MMTLPPLGMAANGDDLAMREKMREVLEFVWNSLRPSLHEIYELALQSYSDTDAQNELKASYRLFTAEIEDILTLEEYIRSEDCDIWEQHVTNLQKVFKKCFRSFLMEEGLPQKDDVIGNLNRDFFTRRERDTGGKMNQSYSTITRVIRSLRNCIEHTMDPPADPVTYVKSFGNYYTLAGLAIHSAYGYSRLLEVWCEAKGVE